MFSLNSFFSSSACSPNATTCSRSCSPATTTSCDSQSNISSFLSSFANRLIKPLFIIVMKISFVLLRFSLRLIWETAKTATECIIEITKVISSEIKNALRA
jgi:hypothetical protein